MRFITRGLTRKVSYNRSLKTRGFLQPGALTSSVVRTRGFCKAGSYIQGRFYKQGSYNKGSYNHGFLQPGVLHPGVLITRGLTFGGY